MSHGHNSCAYVNIVYFLPFLFEWNISQKTLPPQIYNTSYIGVVVTYLSPALYDVYSAYSYTELLKGHLLCIGFCVHSFSFKSIVLQASSLHVEMGNYSRRLCSSKSF